MFNFSFDKRIIYVVIAIMVMTTLFNYINNPSALMSLIISIPGVLVAITFHEFAHGFVAYKLGDNTAKNEGRLTLNPLAHLDPIGSLMLLFAGFGWGKPVNVNSRNYTRKISMEKADALVAAAGPIMNFILALIFMIIYCVVSKYSGMDFLYSTVGKVVLLLLSSLIAVNVGLGVFNLIPLPPLDGSKIIMPFLPQKGKVWFMNNEQLFSILFVVLWITGITRIIITPIINIVLEGIMNLGNFIIR